MKIGIGCICALGLALVVGCDQFERVVGLGHKAQEEEKRAQEQQFQDNRAEERQASLLAERDSLQALINGKMEVLSNRISEAEAALRTLQADRAAFSREVGATTGGAQATNGVGLERALASPVINELAMKYLQSDFSVARGEYAEAIANARACEADYRKAIGKLDQTLDGLVDPDPQGDPAKRRAQTLRWLEREHEKVEQKRVRLEREKIPTGAVYRNRQQEHDHTMRNIESRLREIERMIDRLRTGDERERKNLDQIAARTREKALGERDRAVEKLKREYEKKPNVFKTVQEYTEKTLHRLEQAFVKEAAAQDAKLRASREGCRTLRGIGASVPRLSADGLKKVHDQVMAL